MTTLAHVDNRGAFVGTSKLYICIFDLFSPALWALLERCALCGDVVTLDGLDAGLQFLSEE